MSTAAIARIKRDLIKKSPSSGICKICGHTDTLNDQGLCKYCEPRK